jgi:hypothetical protein
VSTGRRSVAAMPANKVGRNRERERRGMASSGGGRRDGQGLAF